MANKGTGNRVRQRLNTEIVKFKNEGDSFIGVLENIEPTEIEGREAVRATFTHEGGRYSMLLNTVLERELTESLIGSELEIVFTGTVDAKKKGHAPVKLFDIYKLD